MQVFSNYHIHSFAFFDFEHEIFIFRFKLGWRSYWLYGKLYIFLYTSCIFICYWRRLKKILKWNGKNIFAFILLNFRKFFSSLMGIYFYHKTWIWNLGDRNGWNFNKQYCLDSSNNFKQQWLRSQQSMHLARFQEFIWTMGACLNFNPINIFWNDRLGNFWNNDFHIWFLRCNWSSCPNNNDEHCYVSIWFLVWTKWCCSSHNR